MDYKKIYTEVEQLGLYGAPNPKGKWLKECMEDIVKFSCLPIVRTAIDVGCGHGEVVEFLNSIKIDAIGVDVTPRYSWDESKPLYVGDIFSLNYMDKEFDLVVCRDVLEHFQIEDIPIALSELRRVGKYAYLRVCDGPAYTKIPETLGISNLHLSCNLGREVWEDLVTDAGWEIVDGKVYHERSYRWELR